MLDERKERAITALMIGEGPTIASKKAGVSRGTIYDWMKNDDFRNELEIRRKEIVSAGNAYVIANTQSHLEALHEMAIDKKDKRTAAQCAMYLVDRAMGKTSTKIAVDNDINKDKGYIDIEMMLAELDEMDKELNSKVKIGL
jgi:hypothetical protein